MDSLSRFNRLKYLLKPVISQEPSCFLVTNGNAQLFALPVMQLLCISESLAWLDGLALCLTAPTGSFVKKMNVNPQCRCIPESHYL